MLEIIASVLIAAVAIACTVLVLAGCINTAAAWYRRRRERKRLDDALDNIARVHKVEYDPKPWFADQAKGRIDRGRINPLVQQNIDRHKEHQRNLHPWDAESCPHCSSKVFVSYEPVFDFRQGSPRKDALIGESRTCSCGKRYGIEWPEGEPRLKQLRADYDKQEERKRWDRNVSESKLPTPDVSEGHWPDIIVMETPDMNSEFLADLHRDDSPVEFGGGSFGGSGAGSDYTSDSSSSSDSSSDYSSSSDSGSDYSSSND